MYIRREKNGEKGDCEGCEDEERGVAVGGKGDQQRASHGEGRKWWKGAGVREEEEDRRGTSARGTER